VRRAASVLAAVSALSFAPACGGGDREVPPPPADRGLHVDSASRGGRCDDEREPEEVTRARTPWCSIERALEAAPDGATLILHAGSYPGLDVQERAAPVTIRAARGERVELAGVIVAASSEIRLVGLHLTDGVTLTGGSHSIELLDNEITGAGVTLAGVEDVRLERNRIQELRPGQETGSFGIRVTTDDDRPSRGVVIRGNRLRGLSNDAIQLGSAQDVVIEGNLISNVHPAGFDEHADALQVVGGRNIALRGNEIRDVEHGLLFTDKAVEDVTLENNVIAHVTGGLGMKTEGTYGMPGLRVINNTWYDTRYGVQFRAPHERAVVRNNIFDQVNGLALQPVAERNLVANAAKGFEYGSDAILEPPVWADVETLELAPGSPGVDAGTGEGAPRRDRRGRPRADDPATANSGRGEPPFVDVGAHELSPS
jgi:nitrous oxidase accessory protein NosD